MEKDYKYTVSVRLMPYNQEKFIREAMDSVFMQRTNFLIELVIGDDFSTDSTLEIIRTYNNSENVHIKILERELYDDYWRKRQELGRLYNFSNIIENCTGKYVALLDGDDYWTDPMKLQKQVDILELNQDCVACHHWQEVAFPDERGNFYVKPAPIEGQGYYPAQFATVKEIFENKMRVKIRTILFRNILGKFPSWFYDVSFGDVTLSMMLGKFGRFVFINESMAVYRMTGKGVSRSGSEDWFFKLNHYLSWIRIWEYGSGVHQGRYNKEVFKTILSYYRLISKHYDYKFYIFRKLFSYSLFRSKLTVLNRIRMTSVILYDFLKVRIGEIFNRKK